MAARKRHLQLLTAFLLGTGVLAMSGCSSDSSRNSSPASNSSTAPPADPNKPAASRDITPPRSLADAGEYSENVYDMAKAGDWNQAAAKLALLIHSVGQLKNDLRSQDNQVVQMDATLAKLSLAVSSKDRRSAMKESNQMTLAVADIQASYKLEVPVEITKLDYLGRELEIWAAEKDIKKLQDTTAAMRQAWDTVRPAVESNHGSAEAKAFSALLGKVEKARSAAEYGRLAGLVLDEVDNLENVFHPKK